MNWKGALRTNVTKADELRGYTGLTDSQIEHLNRILHQFPMTATRYYLSLIDWDDPARNPVFRIYVPSISEADLFGDFDTSGEAGSTVISGLQHKYPQTALILFIHRCVMYCKHCFRKRLVGISGDETANNATEMAVYVNAHNEISNILISGEDTLVNSNQVIAQYLEHFTPILHLDLIRFGTHTPVALPERACDDHKLLDILKTYTQKRQVYVVTQLNYPKELINYARKAVKTLLDVGVIIENQTVLLGEVNDSSHVLGALLKDLTKCGVVPYYIFRCHPVSGVESQFQIPLMQGYEIVEDAKSMQNGQGKRIRYTMSHVTGRIEILESVSQDEMLLKYHQAKCAEDYDRVFTREIAPEQAWLKEPARQESRNRAAAAETKPLAPILMSGSTGKLLW